ncbi:MAG: TonB-dependent receptor, partial [Acidobacteria bacterium]|nr:TonB-dependent receptor [Acidobacteriota bacterium]
NQYHGTFYTGYSNPDWQSYNIDADQVARGVTGGGGLEPRDTNRLAGYRDFNFGAGGYLMKDKLWWYGSARKVQIDARYTNFPVKPQTTILDNYTAKFTYNLTQNNKLIVFGVPNRKRQPQRFDSYLIGSAVAINTSQDSLWNQDFWAWVYKGEINSVLTDSTFVELRAGEYGYWWRNYRYAETPRIEDTGTNIIIGGNRNWKRDRARHQVIGSFSYFKSGWGGDHNFKVGGEIFDEWVADTYIDGYPGDFVSNTVNGVPTNVYLIGRGKSVNGLWTYSGYAQDNWRVNDRVTMNLGVRFDRYRGYLPAQTHDANRFFDAQSFDAVDNILSWNLIVPRLGLSWDIAGDGKTNLKLNYAQYSWNPGADFFFNVNPNSSRWDRQYSWTDKNGNGYWDPGEEGALRQARGGRGVESIDPDLKDTFTREVAGWFERELVANVGARTGFVWRGERQNYQRVNLSQPSDGFNVPITVKDPGPDGRVGTADDAGTITMYNLDPQYVGLPAANRQINAPNGGTDFYTWEFAVNKRSSNRWSLSASYASTWSNAQSDSLLGNAVRNSNYAWTPNDFINTDNGRFKFRTEQIKLYGTWQAPFDLRVTPQLRYQGGQGFGRTFVAATNYGSVRVLAEPTGTRKQDAVRVVDMKVEKVFAHAQGTRFSVFLDVFNLANTNPAQAISWS